MVPESLDADTLRTIILVALALVVVAMYVVIRFVRRLATRSLLFLGLCVIGLALWVERESLEDCVDTCSCNLFGQEVEIPANRNTGNCQ